MEEVVRQIFAQFREVSRKKLLESVKTNDAARIQKKIKKIQKDLEAKQKELDDLKAETILVIRGVSALDKELLGTLVAEAREALENSGKAARAGTGRIRRSHQNGKAQQLHLQRAVYMGGCLRHRQPR